MSELAVPYVLDDGEGEVMRWLGATVTVKASGPSFDLALAIAVAGGEPALRSHPDHDKGLLVLEGELTIVAGDEVLAAPAGSFAFLPRGVPHTIAVESGRARVALILSPAGAISTDDDHQFPRKENAS
ncbi:MAG: cupin domain-containing protein [Thermoleophilia bacterium]|nr:cupin domain-containing protein [Thermoleophilia bacterium]